MFTIKKEIAAREDENRRMKKDIEGYAGKIDVLERELDRL